MCFSALANQELKRFERDFGSRIDMKAFVRLYWDWSKGSPYKIPKAMQDAFLNPRNAEEEHVRELIRARNEAEALKIQEELFAQKTRLVNAERSLKTKETKKALNDQRIATDKISKAMLRLDDLNRTEPKSRDSRIFPGWYCAVLIEENGERVVRPMRYQCRIEGMAASSDRTKDGKTSGTYNARRDNLTRFWRNQFGTSHGLIIATRFYENVETPDGKNVVLEFTPKTGEDMLIACLWSHWTDPTGQEPNLYSFAAITDEPEAEVAAAGHDRTIINIKPEHVDAWLKPGGDISAMQAIFDDKQHPYYEHRMAA